MSSPLARLERGAMRSALVAAHVSLSHSRRQAILAELLAEKISRLPTQGAIRCLDVGAGDMKIADAIETQSPATEWRCVDVHELPESLSRDSRWQKYQRFNGSDLPFEDGAFDVVLFCDVLHHAAAQQSRLLREAARVGKYVLVKDHFEHGLYSRVLLQAMDFVGNWGYGVNVPRQYFRRRTFQSLCEDAGLGIEDLTEGVRLYDHLPIARWVLRPSWQFIALLRRSRA